MISFYFPPNNTSSGWLRTIKFAKYLQEFGWDSSVLTVPRDEESADDGLLPYIPPHVNVHRAYCADAKRALSIRGRYPGFLTVPDRYVSWLPFAALKGARLVRREGVQALFSTSPVPTAHLIALFVKAITGTPWVADFRDPWVETEGSEVYGRTRQAVELWLERQVVLRADRVLVTTTEFAKYLSDRYGPIVAQKIIPIYNGYDEEDFAGLTPDTSANDSFTISHAGLMHGDYRDPSGFIRALRVCMDRGSLPADTKVHFVGGGQYLAGETFSQLIRDLGLSSVVNVVGRRPYHWALQHMMNASVLLLLQTGQDTRTLIPAKAFEYLRSGRLILALAPADSATARLAREFDGARVALPDAVEDIAQHLEALAKMWSTRTGRVDRLRGGLARYSRRTAAEQLAAVLQSVTDANPRVRR